MKKKYNLKSDKNNYLLDFECLNEKDMNKLNIKINHREMDFEIKKSLEELQNENKCLIKYDSINSVIQFLVKLTKNDNLKINRINKLLYNLIFVDKEENNIIQFPLKRKLDINERSIQDIEEEIININNNLENINNSFEKKLDNLKKIYDKKIEELELKISEFNKIKNSGSTENTNDNQAIDIKNKDSKSIVDYGRCLSIQKEILFSTCILESERNTDSINKMNSYNNQNNIYNSNSKNIFKENNNTISYSCEPIDLNEEKILYKNDKMEKCDIFTAFNLPNNSSIIVWTIKEENNTNQFFINIKNMNDDQEEEIKRVFAHKKQINNLQYFHNEHNNNNFIISLSKNDDEMLKIWQIIDQKTLNHIKTLDLDFFNGKKIKNFCMFNNQKYSKTESYIFVYNENNNNVNKNINYYYLDDNFNLINKNESIGCDNELYDNHKINYLDTFYKQNQNELFLIECNDNNVNITKNPLNNGKTIYFKDNDAIFHLSAFIVERNNNIELFESNSKGIYIWDIYNNAQPQIKILYDFMIYDICLWNDNYLCTSTSKGFHLIDIAKKESILHIDPYDRNFYSKIRKISTHRENKIIIGINHNKSLCLWKIEVKYSKN